MTGALGDYLGDAVAAAVGIEHTAAEFSERAEAAFKRADADGSGTLDFGETFAACRAVPGLRRLSETRAREIFARFDEDDSGSLDVHEFRNLAALLRSAHALDQMPGVIYCGGKLMNPSQNPAVARAARLAELYSKPYAPKSALAKAVARRTVLRRVVYGGVDLANLEALTDDEEAESRSRRSRRTSRRTSSTRKETRKLSWSVGALEAAYAALLVVRLLCAVYGTAYVHPDEYHQTVEIGARDVLGVAASPRAWEFDADGAPARSVAGHVLAAGAAFRVWRFIESFDRNVAHVARATLAGAAGGCERAALAKGLAAGLREAAARVGGGGADEVPGVGVRTDASAFFVSPAVIFLAPRIFAFCASLLVDLAAARAARAAYWAQAPALASPARSTRDRRDSSYSKKSFSGAARAGLHARLLAASAWPAVTLLVRPLTNAVECVLVSSLLCLACASDASDACDDDSEVESFEAKFEAESAKNTSEKAKDFRANDVLSRKRAFATKKSLAATRAALVAGAVTAVGTWTRFTFPLFAAPIGVLLVARAARATSNTTAARGALVAAAAGAAGFAAVASCLVVADTAYFEGVDAVDAAFFGEAFFGGDADARAKRLASVVTVVEGCMNDFIATGVAWFRDPGLPPLDAFSQAWRETSVFVAATRGAAARLARRLASAPWVVTPYNALAYNLDTKNLESHGIHPRCTHTLINFPMLFGPLAWVAYRALFQAARSAATRSGFFTKKKNPDRAGREEEGSRAERTGTGTGTKRTPERATGAVASANATRAALLGVLAVPLVFLSLAPHQEPRFLLPLLPAAAAAAAADGGAASLASSPVALVAWSAANLIGAAFFGFAHQGGVVPAVAQLSTVLAEDDESSDHALVYFWRTYTPPESLLAFPAHAPSFVKRETNDAFVTARDDAGTRASFDFRSERKNGSPSGDTRVRRRASSISPSHIVDLRGASMDSVLAAFAANEDWSHFYVVAPATAAEALRARLAVTSPGAAVAETWRRRGHFSGEELAGYRDAFTRGGVRGLWDAMALGVYAVER